MKLLAKVTDTHSAAQYTDNKRRVTLKVAEADCLNTKLTLRSNELREDDRLVVLVLTEKEGESLHRCLHDAPQDFLFVRKLADQLRPDPPPPFFTQLEAEAEFERRDAVGEFENELAGYLGPNQ